MCLLFNYYTNNNRSYGIIILITPMIIREEREVDLPIKKSILSKTLDDFPLSKELFKFLENKEYLKSFEMLRNIFLDTTDLSYVDLVTLNALWSTYLYENGHQDFLSHMDYAPEYCFAYSNIKEIYIPASIESIPFNFARGCKKVKRIIVDEKNTNYDSRNNCNAIIDSNCNNLIVSCKNTTLLNDIESVEWDAFDLSQFPLSRLNYFNNAYYLGTKRNPYFLLVRVSSTRIKECIIHEKCKVIRPGAFYKCKSLKEIEILKGIKEIPYGLFSDCTNLRNIKLHEGLKWIGYSAFEGCYSLRVLEIPGSVKKILGDTFDETYLQTLILNKGLRSIDRSALCLSCPKEIVFKGTFDEYERIINSLLWLDCKWVYVIASDEMHYIKRSLIWGDFTKEEERAYRKKLIKRLGENPWK